MPKRLSQAEEIKRNEMFLRGLHWCTKCKTFLPVDEFRNNKNTPYGLHLHCLGCEKKYLASRVKERKSYFQTKNRKLKHKWVRKLGGKCQRCGYNEFVSGLEFHHVDPDKKRNNATDVVYSNDYYKALAEIDKCVLMCSNCHRSLEAGNWDAKFTKSSCGWRIENHWCNTQPNKANCTELLTPGTAEVASKQLSFI